MIDFEIKLKIQAICATEHLVEYFKEGLAQWEVNESNEKGYRGRLVAQFDKLITDLTNGEISAFAPTEFRAAIAKRNPELCQAGQQQDSAEILAVILDGLHEDLNRSNSNLKYEEFQDSNGREDAIVSEEHWEVHKKVPLRPRELRIKQKQFRILFLVFLSKKYG